MIADMCLYHRYRVVEIIVCALSPITFFLASLNLHAHSGGHVTRYVVELGSDDSDCTNAASPCATINYAVGQSGKGDTIRVAEGRYVVDELEVFYLLSAMVEIQGGYSTSDGFKQQRPSHYISTIEGVPFSYRDQLADRGFKLNQDQKAIESGLNKTELSWLKTYSALTSTKSASAECVDGLSGSNACHNIDRVAHMPLASFASRPTSANDVWGFVDQNTQREYALIGLSTGTAIVDVTNASTPVEVGHISALQSSWRDIKVYQYFDDAAQRYMAYAYVTTEAAQGLQIIDLNNLPNSVSLAANPSLEFVTAHNVYLANIDYSTGLALEGHQPYLYIAGSNRSRGVFLVYDLSNPLAPELLSQGSSGYVHDATTVLIDDARVEDCSTGHDPCEVLIDFNENTVDIWDMTNKAQPFLISETSYANFGYVHSGWWSQDKKTVFVQDEFDERDRGLNTTLRAMDISDLKQPCITAIYTGPTNAVDHNGYAHGDYYYMSNYRRGLTVLDVSDVRDIKDVGFFDTFAVPQQNSANFNGAWGTYPFLDSGHILVSDIEYGLWVLKLNENDGQPSNPGTTRVSSTCGVSNSPQPAPTAAPIEPPSQNSDSSGGGALDFYALLMLVISLVYVRQNHGST